MLSKNSEYLKSVAKEINGALDEANTSTISRMILFNNCIVNIVNQVQEASLTIDRLCSLYSLDEAEKKIVMDMCKENLSKNN